MSFSILLLAGGVGGAKIAEGLLHSDYGDSLTILGNISDDQEIHGLWVSPDIDTLTYTLTDRIDRRKGWGVKEETNHTLDALKILDQETWMYLGDQDLATHIYRTAQRKKGIRPSVIAADIATKYGLKIPLLLPTDDIVQTRLNTQMGWLDFQSYFVRYQCQPQISAIEFAGAERATATPEALAAIAAADLIIFAPSNPIVSIGAILSIAPIKAAIEQASAYKIAISPLIAGKTIRGPADKMLEALGMRSDALGVAHCYRGLIDMLVIDQLDIGLQQAIENLNIVCASTATMMLDRSDKVQLANSIIDLYLQYSADGGRKLRVSV